MQASADEQLRQALADIEEFLHDNDASSFVDALRPGASEAALAAAEANVGAPLGKLRLLYRWHDGQDWRREREPLFEHLFFLDLAEACRQRETMLDSYVRAPSGTTLESYHKSTRGFGIDELRSDRWLPFANTEGDYLAVMLDTGKVARMRRGEGDLPWLSVEAEELGGFLGGHASALWDGALVLMGDPQEPGVQEDGLRWLGRYFGRG
jgi:cell wall assembly regulator SMI1